MLRIALAQLNLTVGDIDGNVERIWTRWWCAKAGAQVVVAARARPDRLSARGPGTEAGFVPANRARSRVAADTGELLTVIGFVDPMTSTSTTRPRSVTRGS